MTSYPCNNYEQITPSYLLSVKYIMYVYMYISYKNSEESKQDCSNIYAIKKENYQKKSKRLYFYNISNTVSAFALLWCSSYIYGVKTE